MTRVVSFADGFTSASAPSVGSAGQEQYTILNNVTELTNIAALNFADNTCAFISYELSREDLPTGLKRQVGNMLISKTADGFILNLANYQGDDMIRAELEEITLPYEVYFSVTTTGQLQYMSGNMATSGYAGIFKVQITRVF